MKCLSIIALAAAIFSTSAAAENFKLPKEVTPQMRAACEKDVRRLCIGKKPTISGVKRCVRRNFMKLGTRCKVTLAAAGFRGR
ncbi:MAG: hypothetical protein K0U74_11505 [Alphaproteobacteria bacterium]|nr:hypothetical protein [Alphaproteobacteria bacterium]